MPPGGQERIGSATVSVWLFLTPVRMKILTAIFFLTIATSPLAAEEFAPMALNSIAAVPAKIAGARVVDPKGTAVGSLVKVQTDAKGKPLKADIALTGGRTVTLDASALGYDQTANVVVTAMDQAQLAQPAPAR
jgi:hypothetical protein